MEFEGFQDESSYTLHQEALSKTREDLRAAHRKRSEELLRANGKPIFYRREHISGKSKFNYCENRLYQKSGYF